MKPSIYLVIGLSALNGLFFFLTSNGGNRWIYDENSVIENIQAGALMLSFIALISASPFRIKFTRWLTLFFAATCMAMFLREVDVEDLNVPNIIKLIGSGTGRDLIMGTCFIALTIHFLRYYRHKTAMIKPILKSRVAILSIIGGLFLVFGEIGEELGMQLFEELAEMTGALLILTAAILFVRNPENLTGKELV